MQKMLEKCTLCPHKCGANRIKGEIADVNQQIK